MSASALSDDSFAALLSRLPATLDLDALARDTKAIQRRRGIRSGADLLRLGLAWGPGERSLQEVVAWSEMLGFARLTDEALIQRLRKAVGFFEGVTAALLRAVAGKGCWTGRRLRICDGSSLSGPASTGADWRIHCVYDLGVGRFTHVEVTDRHGGEALDRGAPVPGEIRIADRGHADPKAWYRFHAMGGPGTDFIVRMRWNTVPLIDAEGAPFDLIDWLQRDPQDLAPRERLLRVKPPRATAKPMAIRLIAHRKSPEETAKTLDHLRRQASRKQHKLDPRGEVAAGFVVVATSLLGPDYPPEEVLAAYRLRWRIELAIKRLKSLLSIGKLRTRTEAGTRCWLHAHPIMAPLCDDQSQDLLAFFP